jgi:hypothetical protein
MSMAAILGCLKQGAARDGTSLTADQCDQLLRELARLRSFNHPTGLSWRQARDQFIRDVPPDVVCANPACGHTAEYHDATLDGGELRHPCFAGLCNCPCTQFVHPEV